MSTREPLPAEIRDKLENSLIVKLNRVIAAHYPEGHVDYPEAVRALVSITMSYQHMLRKLDAAGADITSTSAVAISRLVEGVALAIDTAESQAREARESRLAGGRHSALVDARGRPMPARDAIDRPRYSDMGFADAPAGRPLKKG